MEDGKALAVAVSRLYYHNDCSVIMVKETPQQAHTFGPEKKFSVT